MSFILPPVNAPHPSDSQPPQAAARSDEPDPNGPDSFGAVLSRSLAPASEASGKAEGKAATAAPTRRPPEGRKADPDELVNAMALPLVPLDNLLPKALAAGGAAAATGAGTVPGAANPALTGLLAGKPLTPDMALAGEPTTAPAPVTSAEDAAQLTLATGLTPELAGASQKDKGLPALPTRLQTAEAGPAVALATAGINGASGASDGGTAGQSPQQRDQANDLPQVFAETTAGSGSEPDTTRGVVKAPHQMMAASDATPTGAGAGASTSASTTVIGQETVTDISAASATPAISSAGVAAAPAPTGMLASSAAPAAMARSLAPEVGSGEWGKALGQQMIHMGKGGEQVAELQLNPPGLGPLKVTLSMNDHQVQAMFVSAHSSVRAAVEAALPQLRSTLADSGISLGNTSVNSESQQQAAFTQGQNGQNGQSGQRGYRAERTPDNLAPVVRPAMEASRSTGRGISVDTYA
jgi:flagellar hook-length control protein FliK